MVRLTLEYEWKQLSFMRAWPSILQYRSEIMQENRKYSYTFYHLYDPIPTVTSHISDSSYYPKTTPFKPAQINTIYSHLYPEPPYEPAKSAKDRKLSSSSTSNSNMKGSYLKTPENDSPITYPYKNPECGINITGKSGFEIKGDLVTVRLDKVLNSRKGGKSGTLQLELVKMSYFYDGTSGIRPQEYSSVGTAQLGELEGGWSFTDVVRTMDKKTDEEHSYRRCYILLLEEFDKTEFKIVDYLNFD